MKYFYKLFIFTSLFLLSLGIYLSTNSFQSDHKFYVVSSGSMSPVLKVGDLVVAKKPHGLQIGDVVTFRSPVDMRNFITHRIVSLNYEEEITYTTKGDGNNTEDPWQLTSDMIVGKLSVSIPKVGYPILFFKSSNIYLITLGLILLAFCLVELNYLSKEVSREWGIFSRSRTYAKFRKSFEWIDGFMGKHFSRVETE